MNGTVRTEWTCNPLNFYSFSSSKIFYLRSRKKNTL